MIYLDHNATTRPDAAVVRAQAWAAAQAWGNPSTAYTAGREAGELLNRARARVAALIGAPDPAQVLFTSGGTEADVTALRGVVGTGRAVACHLVTTLAEHKAVLRTCVGLDGEGVPVSFLPVDGEGRVDPATVGRALGPETALASVLLANNEVGTVNPVAEIAASYERGLRLTALQLYKGLPATNCRECGEPSCLAFATKLLADETSVLACKPLFTPEFRDRRGRLLELLEEAGYEVPAEFLQA